MRRAERELTEFTPVGAAGGSDPLPPDVRAGDSSTPPVGGTDDRAAGGIVRRVIHGISTAMGVLAALLIIYVMFSTAADVVVRQVTGSSLPGVVEYSEVILVALVFLGLAYAQRVKAHIGVDIVTDRLKPRVSHVVTAVGLVLAFVAVAWIAWETAMVAVQAFEAREYRFGLVPVPVWPVRIIVTVGLVALLLELALSIFDEIVGARTGAPTTHAAHPEAAAFGEAVDDALATEQSAGSGPLAADDEKGRRA